MESPSESPALCANFVRSPHYARQAECEAREEIYPEGPLSREVGSLPQPRRPRLTADWVYRGPKGRPTTPLNLYVAQPGRARTYASAKKVCENLLPLGSWQLASSSEIWVYADNLVNDLPRLPELDEPTGRTILYWAAPERNEPQDTRNTDTYFFNTDHHGRDLPASYHETINGLRVEWAKETDAYRKRVLQALLYDVKWGIPVFYVMGTPERPVPARPRGLKRSG